MRTSPYRPAIRKLYQDGFRPAEISCCFGIPSSTVQKTMIQFKARHASELPKSKRPRILNSLRTRGVIKKRIDRNDAMSMNKDAYTLGIGRRTVQMIVKNDLGLTSYRLFRGQFLTDRSKQNRLQKAKKLLVVLKVCRLSKIIWTDEKIFTIEPL